MRHLDLFSGIGGFALAASWVWGAEYEIVGFCEIDSFCQKVLKKHWPEVPIYSDIKELKGSKFDTVELITGGFPCQPFSVAGKRKGADDDRALWTQMFRIIGESRPRWIICENVIGIINIREPIGEFEVESKQAHRFKESDVFNKILTRQEILYISSIIEDLYKAGYELPELSDGTPCIWNIPAASVDARHKRERIWIVAHSKQFRWGRRDYENGTERKIQVERSCSGDKPEVLADTTSTGRETCGSNGMGNEPTGEIWKTIACSGGDVSYADKQRLSAQREQGGLQETQGKARSGIERGSLLGGERNWARWKPEPELGRVVNGIPDRVDRLKSLGNAIVPQLAAVIMQAIKQADLHGNL